MSAYWALGGMWLLATVGRTFEDQARAGSTRLTILGWAAAILKVIASFLPLLALRRLTRPGWNRGLWVLAWLAAGILILYGLVSTAGGLLAELGVLHLPADADHGALAWHTYLWDPWFLIWGLLAAAALVRGRHHEAPTQGSPPQVQVLGLVDDLQTGGTASSQPWLSHR